MSTQLMIILLYLGLTIAIGFYARKKAHNSLAFHGAGLGVLMCVAAGAGEWLGGTSTTGVSEYGYLYGLSGAWYTIANGIGVIVLALFFAKLYRSLDTITVPGIIEKYIGVKARVVSSVLLIFVMLAVGTSQIIAAGTLGVTVLHLSFETSVIILGLGFIAYTLAGGMNAVAYTNMLHLCMHYGGVILALVLVGASVGGIGTLPAHLPQPYFDWMGIGRSKVFSWLIASVLGACTAQAGIQPILAARDVHVARKAALITGLVVAPYGIFTALLGMYARVLLPGLEDAKLAVPTLMMAMNPVAGGIVLASIMSAILSTTSPVILATGTMATKDIYQRVLKPQAGDREILFVSRLFTGAAGCFCILLALILYQSARILDIVYFAYSIRGALFVVLLFGIFWKKTTNKGAISAMILTVLVGSFWVAYHAVTGVFPLNPGFSETYAVVSAAIISTIVFSLWFPRHQH